jgi:hypothetical protein
MSFGEVYWKRLVYGEVEAVEPDHRLTTLVTVVVPSPRRSQDHVAALHVYLFAIDGSEAAVTFDDEAEREGNVTVGGRHLAGENEL